MHRAWSLKEDDFLVKNYEIYKEKYKTKAESKLALRLKRPDTSTRKRIIKLGLRDKYASDKHGGLYENSN